MKRPLARRIVHAVSAAAHQHWKQADRHVFPSHLSQIPLIRQVKKSSLFHDCRQWIYQLAKAHQQRGGRVSLSIRQ
jgi:hypothetical protein